ncbi:MAG TPA: DUF5916 domain-containing protein [Gemmatimonadales bacterium]
MKSPTYLLFLTAASLGAQAPAVRIPRIDAQPAIDGVLDEPVWQQAARLDQFKQYRPVDSRPAEDSTVVLVWYSPTAIYFGIRAYDREPSLVHATLSGRDNIASDDEITIYLDTFNDRRRAYVFGSNPLGVQDDGVRSEGGFSTSSNSPGTLDRNPDFIYESKGQRTAFGYVIEMRIPFKSLRYAGGNEQTWGINVDRITQRTGYEDTWTDVRRASESFLAQDGTITGIHGIHRGVVTEVQPEMTAQLEGNRTPGGSFERGNVEPSLGGNARLGFTSVTLDGTVNPDFSQVESDAGLVTINQRFALFYPERRPFFLEGIELFASPNNLVYTRTIVDPAGGLKLTGKFGPWTVAHLTAIDEPTGAPEALANMTRIRHDIGSNSVAGVTVTDREADGMFNRVASADTRILFGKVYYVQAQLAGSSTRDSSNGATRSAPLWDLEYDRTGRAWGFNYLATGIDQDFSAQSGFVPRTGVVMSHAYNRFSWYGARGAAIEQFSVFGGTQQIWNYDDFLHRRPIEGDGDITATLRLRGGWNLTANGADAFTRFDRSTYASYAVQSGDLVVPFVVPSGIFGAWNDGITVATPLFQHYEASVNVSGGTTPIFPEAARGTAFNVNASLTVRASSSVRAFATLTYSRLRRANDGSEFARTIIPRLKVEVQPTRALFVRVVAQYLSQRQAALQDGATGLPVAIAGVPAVASRSDSLRVDWLLSYQPHPGTEFFLGYGSTLEGDRPFTFRYLTRQQDGFFVKLAYLFRR